MVTPFYQIGRTGRRRISVNGGGRATRYGELEPLLTSLSGYESIVRKLLVSPANEFQSLNMRGAVQGGGGVELSVMEGGYPF
jgi:hypothetical protein